MRLNPALLVKIALFILGLGVVLLVLNEPGIATFVMVAGAILGGGAIVADHRARRR